mmetsp:Transcript_3219/g.6236  ORF Transcript_3219/g.6236 Transcript_3219/m.6236 type:complete len:91 (-) Transcript_3219:418-690(-)
MSVDLGLHSPGSNEQDYCNWAKIDAFKQFLNHRHTHTHTSKVDRYFGPIRKELLKNVRGKCLDVGWSVFPQQIVCETLSVLACYNARACA